MKITLGFVLSLSLITMSCQKDDGGSGKPSDAVGSKAACMAGELKQFGIIGGKTVDASAWVAKSVVFLLQKTSDGSFACTGTLIDKNIILTAAHCVDKAATNPSEKLAVVFSNNPSCEAEQKVIKDSAVKVKRVIVHPAWKKEKSEGSRGDLALIQIEKAAPAGYEAMPLSEAFIAPASTGKVLTAGYGNTVDYEEQTESSLVLRAVILSPLKPATRKLAEDGLRAFLKKENNSRGSKDITDAEIDVFVKAYFEVGPQKEMLFVDQSEEKGICAGDSGGPAFMVRDGRTYLTGVASQVMNTVDSRKCHLVGSHTSTFFHKAWIKESFAKLRNSDSTKTNPFQ